MVLFVSMVAGACLFFAGGWTIGYMDSYNRARKEFEEYLDQWVRN
ncbi:hypothetical protein EV207_101182 [Scopulibacillus darangshiensis]|uniref:Uncharacterized protein n=1 Tax=Scopulibacillus darangshiensis TaxID=442528 RepID=A0A4R2PCT2_9BACL|nr:hypothetical protein [Scopulibacillus darangshiensis]TCP32204.1 hypothetical protein EV207_101182 [Scopulibacillus darangshiensis]